MSHSHRDDGELSIGSDHDDVATDVVVEPPAPTNAEVARAAADARKVSKGPKGSTGESSEEEAATAPSTEHKFLGGGDIGETPPTRDPPYDEDLDPTLARAWATRGPPPPRFAMHRDGNAWIREHRFEAVGFADPMSLRAWARREIARAPVRMSLRGGWVQS
jgi:hypothetical protein